MVPGEYSALRIPTISGRAWAAVDIKMPAPKVAASTTAILNDIVLSTSQVPQSGQFPTGKPLKRVCRVHHAFLTASLNRPVSRPAEGQLSIVRTKEMLQTK